MSVTRRDRFPPWLTRAKVHPVGARVEVLARLALNTKLVGGSSAPVTVVNAPAGFGKSTALVSWRKALIEQGAKVAWLSLDRDDNDPYELVLYVALAMSIAGVDEVDRHCEGASQGDGQSTRRLLNTIHTAVHNHDGQVVLMMDDFDHLGAEIVDAVIEPLIRYAPDNLHLAIACRDDGLLKTADLELKGVARRIGAGDLRFTVNELREFLSPTIGMATVQRLHKLTEGWPVAVRLLRTAFDSTPEIKDLVANLASETGKMATYLSEQVFGNLASDVRTFLMEVAIVDRVDRDLADYLRDDGDSARQFDRLRHLDALVSPVDTVHHSYRLHPIFRDYLCERLKIETPQRAAELHLRAARWYAARGHLLRAVGHCVEGNDQVRAATFIEESGGLLTWVKEGLTRLRTALAMVDEEVIRARPRLSLIQCLVLMKSGKPRDARALFDATRLALASWHEPSPQVDHETTIIDHMLHAYAGTDLTDDLFDSLEGAIHEIPPDEHFIRGHHFTVLCGLNSSRGRFAQSRRYGHDAIREFRAGHSIYGEAYIQIHLGDVAYGEGDGAAAAEHYRKARELIRRHFRDDDAMRLIVDVLFAELRYGHNRLDSIPRAAESFPRQLERREAWFNIFAAAYTTASNLVAVRSDTSAALVMLDEQRDYAISQGMTSLENLILGQSAALMLRDGEVERARLLVAEAGLTAGRYDTHTNMPWRERDVVIQTLARLLIAERRGQDALALVMRFLPRSQAQNHRRSSTVFHLLGSLANDQIGDTAAAARELHSALMIASASGEIRAFLDEGEPVYRLLDAFDDGASAKTVDPGILDRARLVRDAFKRHRKRDLSLTDRELEVLRELVGGSPNKVIARNMGISHNTVRYHLKNIFAKMNVDSRLRAVDAAHRANIL